MNADTKFVKRIEIKATGSLKDLVFLLSKTFSAEPRFFEVVKEAVDFYQFKERESHSGLLAVSEELEKSLMKENTESKNSKE